MEALEVIKINKRFIGKANFKSSDINLCIKWPKFRRPKVPSSQRYFTWFLPVNKRDRSIVHDSFSIFIEFITKLILEDGK